MSARVEDPRLGTAEQRAATIVVLVGVAVLVLRPFVDAAPSTRTALFAASYLTVGLASIAVPLERDRARMAPGLALLLGLGAVVAAASVSGSPVPLPWSSAALPLSVLAAVAEEALFRRLAYGRLERFGAAVAIWLRRSCSGSCTCRRTGLPRCPSTWGPGCSSGGSGGPRGRGPSRRRPTRSRTPWWCSDEARRWAPADARDARGGSRAPPPRPTRSGSARCTRSRVPRVREASTSSTACGSRSSS